MSTDPAPLYAINDPKRALLSAQKMTSKQWAWKCFRIKEMKMISKLTYETFNQIISFLDRLNVTELNGARLSPPILVLYI